MRALSIFPVIVFFFCCRFFTTFGELSTKSSEFKAIANETYRKVLPCLQAAWLLKDNKRDVSGWAFPDDAEEHFQDIYKRTERFRQSPVHEYAAYEGPWIENIFIANYSSKPLSFFRGFIPLFVQWIDTQILRGRHFDNIHHELNQVLRPNVLYLAISQGDVGLGKIGVSHPNILALSAGGFGHVVIPLIRGEIPWVPLPQIYDQEIAFFGNVRQQSRPEILATIKETAELLNMSYKQGYGEYYATKSILKVLTSLPL